MIDASEEPLPTKPVEGDCTLPPPPLPADQLGRYSVERDPDAEENIAQYMAGQAPDETVLHVERVKEEIIMGDQYEVWDVTTDKDRWWVISNWTNLYSQRLFPSLDYTLSFHVGLMMRMRSRPQGADATDPSPFDEVFRRQEQAGELHDRALEPEDFQAAGVQLRECLLSLTDAIRRRIEVPTDKKTPPAGDFISWCEVIAEQLCAGGSNKELRKYLKNTARETWQLVAWLVHDRDANKTASTIAIHAVGSLVGHYVQILERHKRDYVESCPMCKSRDVRDFYDPLLGTEGEYFLSCGVCRWTNHPERQP